MMKQFLIFGFLFIFYSISYAQSTEGPEPPVLKYISVNPVYGNVFLEWDASPSPVDSVLGYFIYRHNYQDALGNIYPNYQVGLLPPNRFTHNDPNPQTKKMQVFYTLASDGPTVSGGFTTPHGTVFGTCKYDSCHAEMNLNWTKYKGWNVERYNIYQSSSTTLSSFTFLTSVSDTFYVQSNIFENQSYNYYIEAVKSDDPTIKSTSKIFSKYTYMPKTPDYIVIDSILNNSKGSSNIGIYFRIDPSSEIKKYKIKAADANSGDFISIYTFVTKATDYFNDLKSSGYSGPVYYKIEATNTCDNLVNDPEISNSISLHVTNNENVNSLQWDAFKPSSDKKITYKIVRANNEVFGILTNLEDQTQYVDDLQDITFSNPLYSNKFCYYILAEEFDTNDILTTSSRSNIQCLYINPEIHLPNAIAPNAESPDNEFKPILSFNATYLIQIYSRWGNLIFSGENQAWNGTDGNGSYVENGTYAYFVRITTEDGNKYEYKGSVSVFY